MLNPYLFQIPHKRIIINQHLKKGDIRCWDNDLVMSTDTAYSLFLTLWNFDVAWKSCEFIAMSEVMKTINKTGDGQ